MQYALLVYGDTSLPPRTDDEGDALFNEFAAYTKDLQARGIMVGGEPLAPPSSATTVRVRDGKLAVSDGPFAETKEYLGGIYVIEAASLDDALQIAAKCPGARFGSVEIRPVAQL